MQNIVTWGQNMSANIEEFACISMGGLFSDVPPRNNSVCVPVRQCAIFRQHPFYGATIQICQNILNRKFV